MAQKLYTEEEVIRAIGLSDDRYTDEILAGLTPIELPSDDDIDDYRASLQQDEQRYENQRK